MMLLAKAALGIGGALVMAGAYSFHEGVIRVDVDEHRAGGDHVHLWVPAALVPMAMHCVPKHHFREATEHAKEFVPLLHIVIEELRKYPDTVFVEVEDGPQHVLIRTQGGRLQIDVDDPQESAHVRVPLSTLDDVAGQLETSASGS